jgi:hypothetical protein
MSPNASPMVNKRFVPFKFGTSLLILIRRSAPKIFTKSKFHPALYSIEARENKLQFTNPTWNILRSK